MSVLAINNEDASSAAPLLKAGCKVNGSLNYYGMSPLLAAALAGSNSWICALIKSGASVRRVDNKGRNVLAFLMHGYANDNRQMALRNSGDMNDLIQMLFAAGASADVTDLSKLHLDSSTLDMIHADKNYKLLSLHEVCRKKIRKHLLSHAGGQQNNLYKAVDKLPLPTKLQRYLLFDVPSLISDQSVCLDDDLQYSVLNWKYKYHNLPRFNEEAKLRTAYEDAIQRVRMQPQRSSRFTSFQPAPTPPFQPAPTPYWSATAAGHFPIPPGFYPTPFGYL